MDYNLYVNELNREKRDALGMDGFNRLPIKQCTEWFNKLNIYTSKHPLHLSRVVAVNDTIEIPCYYCGDPASFRPPSKAKNLFVWRILSRNKMDGKFTLGPVVGGYRENDKEFESRVNMTSNDTMIIRNVQEKDTGMYYCARQVEKKTRWRFTSGETKHFLGARRPDFVRFFFHIDVVLPRRWPPKLVTNVSALPRISDTHANLEYFTNWGEWSLCSICGEEGERWRTGLCWAKMITRTVYISPAFVYYTMLAAPGGIPCRASLFKHYPRMHARFRSNEKMVQSCNIPCVNDSRLEKMTTDLDRLRFQSLAKVPHTNIHVTEGKSVALKCPRASTDTMVYWVNGSNYLTSLQLRNITAQRAEIDVYGVLRFHSTIVADTGVYSCWHTKKRQIVYALTVIPANIKGDWLYHMQFVSLSFIFDTFVFIALLTVKHKHRHVHQPDRSQTTDNDEDEESRNENYNKFYDDSMEADCDDYKEEKYLY
ncbi:uncharacterized protein LOC117336341 [Pecten maximus]|uniref:uncharacterized protein LOC117336341 n=1 Tax=Pecten maximus TaxID=6579 RepID=UPI001458B235|nr:uncharacterized protein LOC117336341 [Pecten maximus]